MKLSKKIFKIHEDEGFFVWEFLWVLGISLSCTFHGVNGNCSEVAFDTLELAEEKIHELEQLEEIEQPFRDGTVSLFLIVVPVALFLIYITI